VQEITVRVVVRVVLSIFLLGLGGCEPFAISMLGVGAGTALRHTIDGVTYRTFTAPAPAVRQASLAALERMGMEAGAAQTFEGGELIYATSRNRTIEIELEPISAKATRLRIAAKNGGFFYDSATAAEIIAQTERLLDSSARGATSANF
jgi:hypothetical protein